MMTSELERKLRELMDLPGETEWVEFKEAKRNFDLNDLGKYFSALSNEANLKGQVAGWLVFGVTNKPPRRIVGTQYRPDRPALDQLKQAIAEGTNDGISFDEIHEIAMPDGRVIMFEIPPAVKGIPTSWKGYFHGRHGESISPLSVNEFEKIRAQTAYGDMSSVGFEDATLNDLEPEAKTADKEPKPTKPKAPPKPRPTKADGADTEEAAKAQAGAGAPLRARGPQATANAGAGAGQQWEPPPDKAEFEHWLRMDLWTLPQAASLLSGLEPPSGQWRRKKTKEEERLYDLLETSCRAGWLGGDLIRAGLTGLPASVYIAWATDKRIDIPPELAGLVREPDSKAEH